MEPSVSLRELRADDGAKIAALGEQTPDTGAVAMRNLFHYDPYTTITALHPNAIGVVAETVEHDGIVGMGMMSTGECFYEGAVLPYAYLFSLSVHPDFRRRGIASQLAAWRVETARKLLGDDAVIFAGIQQGNEGSLRNAAKWSTQRIDGRTTAGFTKMRSSAPRQITGLEVRPAEKDEYEEIANKQNGFYRDYNFYPPRNAETLYDWHHLTPFGFPLRDYYVVVDQRGNLLAGLSATAEGMVTSSQVMRMVWPMRILNAVMQVIPKDGVMKRIQVKDMWFSPEQLEAGRYLWESLRWLWRDWGTMMMSFYDARSPFGEIIQTPRYMPRQSGSLVISAPTPMREEQCIYLHM